MRRAESGLRRTATLIAVLLAMLFTGCAQQQQSQTVFYYLSDSYESMEHQAVFASEHRNVNLDGSWKELIQSYVSGPISTSLRNPFPQGLRITKIYLPTAQDFLEVTFSEEYGVLSGLERTLANACMVMTLEKCTGIERIMLRCENGQDLMNGLTYLTSEMFLSKLETPENEHTINIYFADENDRYLLPDPRKVTTSEQDSLATYIVYQLMEGPKDENMRPVIPDGTRLLNLSVENGRAIVDFSAEFYTNRSRTEDGERMTFYALVNSLTELDTVDCVSFLVEGEPLRQYQYMAVPPQMERWERTIGPVRTGINEFDATLYYQSWSQEYLAAVPTGILRDDAKTMGELIVRALLENEPPERMHCLIPEGTQLLSAETVEGVCHVDLSREFAQITGGYSAERLAVNSLVASLCSIDTIDAVVLTIEGGTVEMPTYELGYVITPSQNWFFPS